jgi:hypothetical protein
LHQRALVELIQRARELRARIAGGREVRAEAAAANCSKVSFLGPAITAYCTDSSNLMIKSSIDVRACVGYLVAEDPASGRLVCRQPMHR